MVRITNLRLAAVVTAIAMLVEAFANHLPALGVVCGLALALWLPGYAMVVALFPPGAMRGPERLLLALGLSVVIAILGGLVLNLFPFGLRTLSWAILLGGTALCALLIAWIRGHEVDLFEDESYIRGPRKVQWLLFGGAFALVAAASIVAILGAEAQYSGSAAQLWMLPGAVVDGKQTVTIGVDNLEATPLQGTIVVTLGGQVIDEPPSLTLDAGARWQVTLAAPVVNGAEPQLLEVQLTGTGISTALTRHVSIWVAPAPTQSTALPTQTAQATKP